MSTAASSPEPPARAIAVAPPGEDLSPSYRTFLAGEGFGDVVTEAPRAPKLPVVALEPAGERFRGSYAPWLLAGAAGVALAQPAAGEGERFRWNEAGGEWTPDPQGEATPVARSLEAGGGPMALPGRLFGAVEDAERWWAKRRPALFLDRDGVICVDSGYPHKREEAEIIPETAAAIRRANAAGWWVIVLSNQSGIGRGYFPLEAWEAFNGELSRQLAEEGARVDRWFCCPYHPEAALEPYRRHSFDRKPLPGMALAACREFPVAIARSVMIGDRSSDFFPELPLATILIDAPPPPGPLADRLVTSCRRGDLASHLPF